MVFHAWIARLGLSTYDYIGYKKKLKEKKAEVAAGTLTEQEFNDWKQKALIFPEKRQSSIFTKRNTEKHPDLSLRNTPRQKSELSISMTINADVPKKIKSIHAPHDSVVIDMGEEPREISAIQVVNQDSKEVSVLYSVELNEREEDDGEAGVIIGPETIEVGEEKVEEVKLEESVGKSDPNSPEHYKIEDRQDEEDENPYSGKGA